MKKNTGNENTTKFCNHPFPVAFLFHFVPFVFCPNIFSLNLNSVQGFGGAKPQPVALQGAMLLLCGGSTQTRHEDRDLERDLHASIVTTARNRDLENGMQGYFLHIHILFNSAECLLAPTVIICATRVQ